MTSSFESVSFNNNDQLPASQLNQLASNTQYLFENLATVRYRAPGVNRATNTKILACRTAYGATDARQARVDVYFNGFFSSGCSPICVATAISTPQKRLIVTIAGLGNATAAPDSRGCMVQVEADELYGNGTTQLGGRLSNAGFIDMIICGF